MLRTAKGSARTAVVVRDSSGEPLPGDWADLRRAIQDPRTGPPGLRPWLITTVDGVVTSVVGQVYEIA